MPPSSSAEPASGRVCRAAASSSAAAITRLFPAPGSPLSSTTPGRPAAAAASACSSAASSLARPTMPVLPARCVTSIAAVTPNERPVCLPLPAG